MSDKNAKTNVNSNNKNEVVTTKMNLVSKEKLQILYSNVDGITNKMDDLLSKINSTNPDIVLLCESKLNDTIGNEGFPNNFQIIRRDRVRKEEAGRGGGCAFL